MCGCRPRRSRTRSRCRPPRSSADRRASTSTWSSPTRPSRMQPVQLRQDDGKIAVIGKGLDDGVQVVVNGQSRLQSGTRCRRKRERLGKLTGPRPPTKDPGPMSISTPFIKRPIATSLIMAAILLVGIAAYPLLPVAPLPNVDFPTIQVTGKLPGASPDTIAATVAQPLERQFAQIPGVSQMTSISVLGRLAGHRAVRSRAQHRRRRAGHPGRDQRRLRPVADAPCRARRATGRSNPSDSPILILAVQSDEMPLISVDDYADNILSQQISQIAGRRPGLDRRRAEARDSRAGRSGAPRRHGPHAGRRAHHAGQRHRQQPEGQHRRPAHQLHPLRQRPAHQGVRVRERGARLPQRRAGAGEGYRPRDRRAGERSRRQAGRTDIAASSSSSSSSRTPTSSRPWIASRRSCLAWSPRSRPRSMCRR